jgi:hypothetical protein
MVGPVPVPVPVPAPGLGRWWRWSARAVCTSTMGVFGSGCCAGACALCNPDGCGSFSQVDASLTGEQDALVR